MRKLVTTVATAVTLGVMGFAAPAFADSPAPQAGYNQTYKGPANPYAGPKFDDRRFEDQGFEDRGFEDRGFGDRGFRGRGFDDHRFDRNGNFHITFDFGRHDRGFDRWERGWGSGGYDQFRLQQPLNYWRLTRRLEAQGFYGVRGLRPARWGFGYRAFAFNYRGQPVMLRINPYTGRVLDQRYI
ncbi:MAG: hypothetical protein KBA31_10785 [Alphaproteobacteria bacterium]|nr:hypothetical protein [Alphaproteobacteria bacterium]